MKAVRTLIATTAIFLIPVACALAGQVSTTWTLSTTSITDTMGVTGLSVGAPFDMRYTLDDTDTFDSILTGR